MDSRRRKRCALDLDLFLLLQIERLVLIAPTEGSVIELCKILKKYDLYSVYPDLLFMGITNLKDLKQNPNFSLKFTYTEMKEKIVELVNTVRLQLEEKDFGKDEESSNAWNANLKPTFVFSTSSEILRGLQVQSSSTIHDQCSVCRYRSRFSGYL